MCMMLRQTVSLVFVACLVLSAKADEPADEPADDDHGIVAVQHDAETFAAALQDKTQFTMFYAPWCGHCKRLAPTWDQLASEYNTDGSPVTIGKVDCTEQQALCAENGVKGYPTLKLFYKADNEGIKFTKARSLATLKAYLEDKLKAEEEEEEEKVEEKKPEEAKKEEPKKEEEKKEEVPVENVVVLTDDTFDAHIETGHALVKFYAPWCGHCKRLAPIWDELAATFKDEDGVSIAKVDCTSNKGVCGKNGVRAYPTLKFFSGGQFVGDYNGGRGASDFEAYVKKMITDQEAKKVEDDGKVPEAAKDEKPEVKKVEEKKSEEPKKEEEKKEEVPVENVVVLTDDTFDAHIETRHAFIKFYAPWCGHCKRLAPIWDELAATFKAEDGVSIAKVDCTSNKGVCGKIGVRAYPTLKFFSGGQHVSDYNGGRGATDLEAYVKKMVTEQEAKKVEDDGKAPEAIKDEKPVEKVEEKKEEEKKEEKKEEKLEEAPVENVVVLTDDTFEAHIETRHAFVKFYAPWCGHCKRLAPIWDELAATFKDEEGVSIAKVDCTSNKGVCGKNGVRAYPSLKFFSGGKHVSDYSGGRGPADLAAYVKKMVTPLEDKKGEEEEEPWVVEIDDEDFEVEEYTLIYSYLPTCASCQEFLPIWEAIAKKAEDIEKWMFGRINCEKHANICKTNGLIEPMTIRLFRAGKGVEDYTGEKTAEDIIAYVEEKAKEPTPTHDPGEL